MVVPDGPVGVGTDGDPPTGARSLAGGLQMFESVPGQARGP